jgi:hypothetical protein
MVMALMRAKNKALKMVEVAAMRGARLQRLQETACGILEDTCQLLLLLSRLVSGGKKCCPGRTVHIPVAGEIPDLEYLCQIRDCSVSLCRLDDACACKKDRSDIASLLQKHVHLDQYWLLMRTLLTFVRMVPDLKDLKAHKHAAGPVGPVPASATVLFTMDEGLIPTWDVDALADFLLQVKK